MSYILDALRKSEAERRQAEPAMPVLEPRTLEPPRREIGTALTVLAAAAAGTVLVGAWWVFSANLEPRLAPVPAVVAPAEPAAPPASDANAPSDTAQARPPEQVAEKTAQPGAEPTPAMARAEPQPAPELRPSPFAVPPARGSTRDLAEEARVDPPRARASVAPARQARAPSLPEAAKPAPAPEPAPVKFLYAMPDEFRRGLPPLAVTIHVYAPRPADRILYINNRQYRVGDQVGQGIRLEQIVEDGAVLSYHGKRFKLSRPS